eukprot:2047980-Prymnesium_polylepis.1
MPASSEERQNRKPQAVASVRTPPAKPPPAAAGTTTGFARDERERSESCAPLSRPTMGTKFFEFDDVPYYYLRVRQLGLRGSAPRGHWPCLSSARPDACPPWRGGRPSDSR